MSKMKRIFSLVLVFAMVLGSFGTVFAAADVATEDLKKVPKDVIGTEYEKAVSRLVAFDVLNGYKDGTYKPEQDVTRAEFAKILVEALGIGNAAKAAEGKVTFPDVPASHWASGYVNVASGQGLVEGFPNGEFKPNDQVTYAEALTMLVRALGYQDSFLKGVWPGSHIAKAAEAGITSGVSYSDARGFANRGKVAQMVNNSLDADVVKVETYKDGTVEYTESNVSLLKDKLEVSKYEDTRVIADKILDDGLNEDEIKVLFLKDIDKNEDSVKKSYSKNTDRDFTVTKNVNARALIGEEVSVYMNDNDEVVYIETENDDRANFDYVDEIEKGNQLSLVKFDKEYRFDDDAKVYVFNQSDKEYKYYDGEDLQKDNDVEDLGVVGKVGKFVVKNNKIVFAEILDSVEASPLMVVLENNKGELEGINKETEDFKLDLTEDGSYDYTLVYDIDGNEMDIEDIEEGNVVYAQLHDYSGDDVAVVRVVTDNKLEGAIGKFREDRVEIDGKFVKAINHTDGSKQFDSYYTINTLDDIKQWDSGDWESDLDDAYDEDATVYLDAVGRIAFLQTGADSVSGYKFGIVTRTYADGDRVKIFTSLDGEDGEEITLKADKEINIVKPRLISYDGSKFTEESKKEASRRDVLGAAVKFRINKNGEISEDEFYMMDRSAVFTMNADFGKDTMRTIALKDLDNDVNKEYTGTMENGKEAFSVKGNVAIVDAENLNPLNEDYEGQGYVEQDKDVDVDDFSIALWEDMRSTKEDQKVRFYVFPKKNRGSEVDGLVFVGSEGANTASDKEAIYVRDRWRSGDDIIVEYIAYGSNERVKATVDNATDIIDVDRRTPYVAEKRSNDKIKLYGLEDADENNEIEDKDVLFTFVKGKVERVTGSIVEVNEKTYNIGNSAVVYDGGDKKSTSNIKKGEGVMMIVEDNIKVRVVKLDVDVDGDSGSGDPVVKGDKVTYINDADNVLMIDKEAYEVSNTVTLFDADGLVAVGKTDVLAALAKGDVIEKFTAKDGVISEITAKTLQKKDAEAAHEAQVEAAEEAVTEAKAAAEAAATKVTEAEAAKTEADKAVTEAKAAAEAAETKVTEAEAAKTKADDAVTNYKGEDETIKATLKAAVEAAETKVTEAKAAKTEADKAVTEAEAAAAAAETKVTEAKAAKTEADKAVTEAEAALEDLKSE